MSQHPNVLRTVVSNNVWGQQQKPSRISKVIPINKQLIQALHQDEYRFKVSRYLATAIKRYVKSTPKNIRETPEFVNELRTKINVLHQYNVEVAKVKNKYPRSKRLFDLLICYVELEFEVLYKKPVDVKYERKIEQRVLRLLKLIFMEFYNCEENLMKSSINVCKTILRLLADIRREYRTENRLVSNIAIVLLNKIGILSEAKEIREQNISLIGNDPIVLKVTSTLSNCGYATQNESDSSDEEENISPVDFNTVVNRNIIGTQPQKIAEDNLLTIEISDDEDDSSVHKNITQHFKSDTFNHKPMNLMLSEDDIKKEIDKESPQITKDNNLTNNNDNNNSLPESDTNRIQLIPDDNNQLIHNGVNNEQRNYQSNMNHGNIETNLDSNTLNTHQTVCFYGMHHINNNENSSNKPDLDNNVCNSHINVANKVVDASIFEKFETHFNADQEELPFTNATIDTVKNQTSFDILPNNSDLKNHHNSETITNFNNFQLNDDLSKLGNDKPINNNENILATSTSNNKTDGIATIVLDDDDDDDAVCYQATPLSCAQIKLEQNENSSSKFSTVNFDTSGEPYIDDDNNKTRIENFESNNLNHNDKTMNDFNLTNDSFNNNHQSLNNCDGWEKNIECDSIVISDTEEDVVKTFDIKVENNDDNSDMEIETFEECVRQETNKDEDRPVREISVSDLENADRNNENALSKDNCDEVLKSNDCQINIAPNTLVLPSNGEAVIKGNNCEESVDDSKDDERDHENNFPTKPLIQPESSNISSKEEEVVKESNCEEVVKPNDSDIKSNLLILPSNTENVMKENNCEESVNLNENNISSNPLILSSNCTIPANNEEVMKENNCEEAVELNENDIITNPLITSSNCNISSNTEDVMNEHGCEESVKRNENDIPSNPLIMPSNEEEVVTESSCEETVKLNANDVLSNSLMSSSNCNISSNTEDVMNEHNCEECVEHNENAIPSNPLIVPSNEEEVVKESNCEEAVKLNENDITINSLILPSNTEEVMKQNDCEKIVIDNENLLGENEVITFDNAVPDTIYFQNQDDDIVIEDNTHNAEIHTNSTVLLNLENYGFTPTDEIIEEDCICHTEIINEIIEETDPESLQNTVDTTLGKHSNLELSREIDNSEFENIPQEIEDSFVVQEQISESVGEIEHRNSGIVATEEIIVPNQSEQVEESEHVSVDQSLDKVTDIVDSNKVPQQNNDKENWKNAKDSNMQIVLSIPAQFPHNQEMHLNNSDIIDSMPSLSNVDDVQKKGSVGLTLLANVAFIKENLSVNESGDNKIDNIEFQACPQSTPKRKSNTRAIYSVNKQKKQQKPRKLPSRKNLPRSVKDIGRKKLDLENNARKHPTNSITKCDAMCNLQLQLKVDNNCKPNDFMTSNHDISPPANNIYTGIVESNATSEDSNDSCDNNLLIDEGDMKSDKDVELVHLPIYDENTVSDSFEFIYTEKSICISIPEIENNCVENNFLILQQVEEFVDRKKENNPPNLNTIEYSETSFIGTDEQVVDEFIVEQHQIENASILDVTDDCCGLAEICIHHVLDENEICKISKTTDHSIENILNKKTIPDSSPSNCEELEASNAENDVQCGIEETEDDTSKNNENLNKIDENGDKPIRTKAALKSYDKSRQNPYVRLENYIDSQINLPKITISGTDVEIKKAPDNLENLVNEENNEKDTESNESAEDSTVSESNVDKSISSIEHNIEIQSSPLNNNLTSIASGIEIESLPLNEEIIEEHVIGPPEEIKKSTVQAEEKLLTKISDSNKNLLEGVLKSSIIEAKKDVTSKKSKIISLEHTIKKISEKVLNENSKTSENAEPPSSENCQNAVEVETVPEREESTIVSDSKPIPVTEDDIIDNAKTNDNLNSNVINEIENNRSETELLQDDENDNDNKLLEDKNKIIKTDKGACSESRSRSHSKSEFKSKDSKSESKIKEKKSDYKRCNNSKNVKLDKCNSKKKKQDVNEKNKAKEAQRNRRSRSKSSDCRDTEEHNSSLNKDRSKEKTTQHNVDKSEKKDSPHRNHSKNKNKSKNGDVNGKTDTKSKKKKGILDKLANELNCPKTEANGDSELKEQNLNTASPEMKVLPVVVVEEPKEKWVKPNQEIDEDNNAKEKDYLSFSFDDQHKPHKQGAELSKVLDNLRKKVIEKNQTKAKDENIEKEGDTVTETLEKPPNPVLPSEKCSETSKKDLSDFSRFLIDNNNKEKNDEATNNSKKEDALDISKTPTEIKEQQNHLNKVASKQKRREATTKDPLDFSKFLCEETCKKSDYVCLDLTPTINKISNELNSLEPASTNLEQSTAGSTNTNHEEVLPDGIDEVINVDVKTSNSEKEMCGINVEKVLPQENQENRETSENKTKSDSGIADYFSDQTKSSTVVEVNKDVKEILAEPNGLLVDRPIDKIIIHSSVENLSLNNMGNDWKEDDNESTSKKRKREANLISNKRINSSITNVIDVESDGKEPDAKSTKLDISISALQGKLSEKMGLTLTESGNVVAEISSISRDLFKNPNTKLEIKDNKDSCEQNRIYTQIPEEIPNNVHENDQSDEAIDCTVEANAPSELTRFVANSIEAFEVCAPGFKTINNEVNTFTNDKDVPIDLDQTGMIPSINPPDPTSLFVNNISTIENFPVSTCAEKINMGILAQNIPCTSLPLITPVITTTTNAKTKAIITETPLLNTTCTDNVGQTEKPMVYPFCEDGDGGSKGGLLNSSLSMEEISPTKLQIGSNQSLDLISPPVSMSEISGPINLDQNLDPASVSYISVPESNHQIQQANKPNSFDLTDSVGGPLLSVSNEENFLTTDISISVSPEQYPINESQLEELPFINDSNIIVDGGNVGYFECFLPCKKEKPDYDTNGEFSLIDPNGDDIQKGDNLQNTLKLAILVDTDQHEHPKSNSLENSMDRDNSSNDYSVSSANDFAISTIVQLGGGQISSEESHSSPEILNINNISIMETNTEHLSKYPTSDASSKSSVMDANTEHYHSGFISSNDEMNQQKVVVESIEQCAMMSSYNVVEHNDQNAQTMRKVDVKVSPRRPSLSKLIGKIPANKPECNSDNESATDAMSLFISRKHHKTPVSTSKKKSVIQQKTNKIPIQITSTSPSEVYIDVNLKSDPSKKKDMNDILPIAYVQEFSKIRVKKDLTKPSMATDKNEFTNSTLNGNNEDATEKNDHTNVEKKQRNNKYIDKLGLDSSTRKRKPSFADEMSSIERYEKNTIHDSKKSKRSDDESEKNRDQKRPTNDELFDRLKNEGPVKKSSPNLEVAAGGGGGGEKKIKSSPEQFDAKRNKKSDDESCKSHELKKSLNSKESFDGLKNNDNNTIRNIDKDKIPNKLSGGPKKKRKSGRRSDDESDQKKVYLNALFDRLVREGPVRKEPPTFATNDRTKKSTDTKTKIRNSDDECDRIKDHHNNLMNVADEPIDRLKNEDDAKNSRLKAGSVGNASASYKNTKPTTTTTTVDDYNNRVHDYRKPRKSDDMMKDGKTTISCDERCDKSKKEQMANTKKVRFNLHNSNMGNDQAKSQKTTNNIPKDNSYSWRNSLTNIFGTEPDLFPVGENKKT